MDIKWTKRWMRKDEYERCIGKVDTEGRRTKGMSRKQHAKVREREERCGWEADGWREGMSQGTMLGGDASCEE